MLTPELVLCDGRGLCVPGIEAASHPQVNKPETRGASNQTNTHTHTHLYVFVRTFIAIMYHPVPYHCHPSWPHKPKPNPKNQVLTLSWKGLTFQKCFHFDSKLIILVLSMLQVQETYTHTHTHTQTHTLPHRLSWSLMLSRRRPPFFSPSYIAWHSPPQSKPPDTHTHAHTHC